MFKRCTYFFIPFLLYSSTYGMDDYNQKSLNKGSYHNAEENLHHNYGEDILPNYDTLSFSAQFTAKALAYVIQYEPDKKEVKRQFAGLIRQLTPPNTDDTMLSDLTHLPWDSIQLSTKLSNLDSKSLQDLFTVIQNNGGKDQEKELFGALLDTKVVRNYFPFQPAAPESSKAKGKHKISSFNFPFKEGKQEDNLSDKKQDNNKINEKTDIPNDKESETPSNNNKKLEDPKKPTISLSKVIAVTGILGTIALIYYKHSKVNEHPTQTA